MPHSRGLAKRLIRDLYKLTN